MALALVLVLVVVLCVAIVLRSSSLVSTTISPYKQWLVGGVVVL
jgi:hypothetical protein